MQLWSWYTAGPIFWGGASALWWQGVVNLTWSLLVDTSDATLDVKIRINFVAGLSLMIVAIVAFSTWWFALRKPSLTTIRTAQKYIFLMIMFATLNVAVVMLYAGFQDYSRTNITSGVLRQYALCLVLLRHACECVVTWLQFTQSQTALLLPGIIASLGLPFGFFYLHIRRKVERRAQKMVAGDKHL